MQDECSARIVKGGGVVCESSGSPVLLEVPPFAPGDEGAVFPGDLSGWSNPCHTGGLA